MPTAIPLVDCHMHLAGFDDVSNMAAVLAACGLEAVNVLSLTRWKEEYAPQNVLCLLCKLLYPGRVYAFGSPYHPALSAPGEEWDLEAQARRLAAMGCDGVKMYDGKPEVRKEFGLSLDSPAYDGIFSYLQEEGLPVLYHVADPSTFWDPAEAPQWARDEGWFYGDGTYPPYESFYREIDGLLAKFPRLAIIFAHFFFLSGSIERAASFLDRHPRACLDLTPGGEMYVDFDKDPVGWREFFLRYQDRILLGTDNGGLGRASRRWAPDLKKIERDAGVIRFIEEFLSGRGPVRWKEGAFEALGLDDAAVEKIVRGNFRRLAGPSPRPVDAGKVLEECRWLLERLSGREGAEDLVEFVGEIGEMVKSLRDGDG